MEIKVDKKLIFFLGALGGLLYGYDMGVISGALLFIKDDYILISTLKCELPIGKNYVCCLFLSHNININ